MTEFLFNFKIAQILATRPIPTGTYRKLSRAHPLMMSYKFTGFCATPLLYVEHFRILDVVSQILDPLLLKCNIIYRALPAELKFH